MAKDGLAKIKLPNGREVWRDGRGRYRSTTDGKWVSRREVEAALAATHQPAAAKAHTRLKPKSKRAPRAETEKKIMEAVQHMGRPAATLEEAIGHLLAVQAEIALDKDNGAKSTSAARLIGQFTGTLGRGDKDEKAEAQDQPWFVLGRARAKELLALVEAEQARRKEGKPPDSPKT